jgi:hypothetical protein
VSVLPWQAHLRLRRRHALHAVHARFELELRIDRGALDLERCVAAATRLASGHEQHTARHATTHSTGSRSTRAARFHAVTCHEEQLVGVRVRGAWV